jgi:tartrate/fumarate subfamily iron-sulfur-dependent hydro-lyase alpha chain
MITKDVMQEAIFQTIQRGACRISPDVEAAFRAAAERETTERAKQAFVATLSSLEESAAIRNPLCPDTGWPLFFCKVGNEAQIEGGIVQMEETAREMVAKATRAGYLRSTMKHPLTGYDPGTNVGPNVPGFTYQFVPGDSLQISYVAKGGGSECFGGTRYRVVAFADGLTGIKKTVIDWYIAASRAGAICPPSILGVGIGGTADIATNLAKEAAALRIIGSRHPEPEIARIEVELAEAINSLDIGPMGSGGKTSVFAVNVEYSLTHLAGIAVAMSANCWVARRATTRIHADGRVEPLDQPNWFGGR